MTINRPGPDTEVVVGECGVDWTGLRPTVRYQGLGDDPAAYRVCHVMGRVHIDDEHWPDRQYAVAAHSTGQAYDLYI